jgi:hypothetical protein
MDLFERISAVQQQAVQNFSGLTAAQVNWKPEPTKWSIAQCLNHLMVANTSYFPIFDRLLGGSYHLPFFHRLNPFNKSLGALMVRYLGPQVTKKLTAPKLFTPSASDLPPDIVSRFSEHQETVKAYFSKLQALDCDRIVIVSPASNFVTYSLRSAMQIITVHEQRHLNQARRVFDHPNFPKS